MEVIIRCPQCGKRVFDVVGKTYGKINIKCPHCKRLVSIKLKVMKENKHLTHN